MLIRDRSGKLMFDELGFEILIGDLLLECQTNEEVEWLQEKMKDIVNGISDEWRDGVLWVKK